MNIVISTENLGSDIRTISGQVDDLNAAKEMAMACLNNLNGMWEGAAHNAFVQQCAVDQVMMNSLISKLQNLVECLEYAKSEYERCNENVVDKIASIRLSNDS